MIAQKYFFRLNPIALSNAKNAYKAFLSAIGLTLNYSPLNINRELYVKSLNSNHTNKSREEKMNALGRTELRKAFNQHDNIKCCFCNLYTYKFDPPNGSLFISILFYNSEF